MSRYRPLPVRAIASTMPESPADATVRDFRLSCYTGTVLLVTARVTLVRTHDALCSPCHGGEL